MKPGRGRFIVVALFLVAAAVSFIALRKPLTEEWYLHRLGSADRSVRENAARRLGELECYRAIPGIARLYCSEENGSGFIIINDEWEEYLSVFEVALDKLSGPRAIPYLVKLVENREEFELYQWAVEALALHTRSEDALHALARERAVGLLPRFGHRAVPFLLSALEKGDHEVLELLKSLGPLAKVAVPELLEREFLDGLENVGWEVASPSEGIQEMILGLGSDDLMLDHTSSLALREAGPVALPALVEALGNRNVKVRISALETIGSMGEGARQAIPDLKKSTRDPHREVREKALWALAEVGGDPAGYVKLLLRWLQGGGERTPAHAARELARLGSRARAAGPALRASLGKGNQKVRIWSLCALARIYPGDSGPMRQLVKIVKGGDPVAASRAMQALGEIGPLARAAVPVLVRALQDRNLQLGAVASLFKLGAEGIHPLLEILKVPGEDTGLRWHIKTSLVEISDVAALPLLSESLDHPERDVRLWALTSLAGMGPEALPALPALIRRVSTRDSIQAARAIGWIGSQAVAAVGTLEQAMMNENDQAAWALSRIGPPALPALLRGMGHPHLVVRMEAAGALGSMGPAAKSAVPALLRMLDDMEIREISTYNMSFFENYASQIPVSEIAARALGDLGPVALEAVPALLEKLGSQNMWLSVAASRALGKMGPGATPDLERALSDPREEVRGLAAFALGRIGPDAVGALPALLHCLDDASELVRCSAAEAIGLLGPAAREALPELQALAADESRAVQLHAEAAVKRLSGL